MPELPEVETARRRAQRALRGKRIVGVSVVHDPIVYEGVTPARFAATLRGRHVLAVHRKGKHLWMELDRPPFPLFHFRIERQGHRLGAPPPAPVAPSPPPRSPRDRVPAGSPMDPPTRSA